MPSLSALSSTGQQPNSIDTEELVASDKDPVFGDGLSDHHPVEGVSMVMGQVSSGGGVDCRDVEKIESKSTNAQQEIVVHPELGQGYA